MAGDCPVTKAHTSRRRWLFTAGPVISLALGAAVVASAQSTSPFANKKKRQAWETPAPQQQQQQAPQQTTRQPATPYAPPAQTAPVPARSYAQPNAPTYTAPPVRTQPIAEPDWSQYQPSSVPTRAPAGNTLPEGYTTQPSLRSRIEQQPTYAPPAQVKDPYGEYDPYESGRASAQGYGEPSDPQQPYAAQGQSQAQGQPGPYAQGPYGQAPAPRVAGPGPNAQHPRGWMDRLGLRNISTLFNAGIRGGAAARNADDWEEAFIGDADAELEVSAITDGGVEYGVHTQLRAQYDPGRRGFVRRLPDCPPTVAGCASVIVDGMPVALRGHTSQAYSFGPDVGKDTQIALESAHLFLRTAYGDVTVGRDDGAAYLFSLGAPTLLNVGASNSPVDYTGLDAVKTVNDASGFAEKVTYTSPRLLGDQIGVGVQFGVSYALDPNVCGVDYCVERAGIENVLTPDLEDVIEAGLSLDRTFRNGVSVEGTLTYARASEQSGLAAFDDLSSYGAGLEVKLSDWTLGGSYLLSNQGLADGDYEAYDVGLTWQPSALGFTLGYGHATDALVGMTSDQFTGGISYDLRENIRIGAGVQYSDRETVRAENGLAATGSDSATALFIEGGITF